MSDAEKMILEKLDALTKEVHEIKEETLTTNERLNQTNERLDQTNQRLDQTNQRLDQTNQKLDQTSETLEQKIGQCNESINQVRDMTLQTQLLIENEISPKINIIGEGHDFLKMRLEEALRLEKARERMELEIVDLRMEVKKIKAHLNIA